MSVIIDLFRQGQSLWLDDLRRGLLTDGGLKRLVEAGVRGVTSNPTIFFKAVSESGDYDGAICELLQADPEMDAATLYQWLSVQDTQMAADILRGVYNQSGGGDGYVSLEVPPALAYDTDGTVEVARQLWHRVNRPNLMIKVPATQEGLPAIARLIAEGINVNVTLLFSIARYEEVVEAYVEGLARNPHPERVASVASFFVSRVDTKADADLEALGAAEAQRLGGRIAIANAKAAYQRFLALKETGPYRTQRRRGARVQRLLWASTSTKRKDRSDIMYVQELIGPETVNTVPAQTLDAFVQHGEARASLTSGVEAAQRELQALDACGIDLDTITATLEREGVVAFSESYERLLTMLRDKRLAVTRDFAAS